MKIAPLIVSIVALALAQGPVTMAQTAPPAAAPAAQAPAAGPTFKQEELGAMLAPIALYPDSLLSQILMASTYPLEIVEAARWQKENASLKGTALEDALTKQPWDESVKSLTAFPDVLQRMNKDLTWTQKLGDAFLAQQAQMMDTIQELRRKAQDSGNLKTNEQQKVEVQTQDSKQYIVIEPANPQVVYVPTYQPTVVYGGWPYPAYPPYYPTYWAPVGAAFVSGIFWGAGIAAGAALWGGCNWGNNSVNVNVNRYNSFNRTNISNSNWNHNVNHRGAVPYRDNASRGKYGNYDRQAAQARDQFRGRDSTLGGQSLGDRGGAGNRGQGGVGDRGQGGVGDRGQGGVGDRGQGGMGDRGGQAGVANRAGQGGMGDRGGGAGARPDLGVSSGGSAQRNFGGSGGAGNRGSDMSYGGGGAFGGGNGGQARQAADRGHSSMGASGSRGGGGGASRGGGGGGARGGGGGGGRGGGGRR